MILNCGNYGELYKLRCASFRFFYSNIHIVCRYKTISSGEEDTLNKLECILNPDSEEYNWNIGKGIHANDECFINLETLFFVFPFNYDFLILLI